jgi:hypothetical protein
MFVLHLYQWCKLRSILCNMAKIAISCSKFIFRLLRVQMHLGVL